MINDNSKRKTAAFLVVEDNSENMNYILFILRKLGKDYISAESAEKALDLLNTTEFQCGLFDINLGPGMSGVDLIEKIREHDSYQETPIIAVTAYYGNGTHMELLSRGFTDYMPKPFDYNQAKALVEKYFHDVSDREKN